MEEEDLEWDQLECGYLFSSLFFKKKYLLVNHGWLKYRAMNGKVYCCL